MVADSLLIVLYQTEMVLVIWLDKNYRTSTHHPNLSFSLEYNHLCHLHQKQALQSMAIRCLTD